MTARSFFHLRAERRRARTTTLALAIAASATTSIAQDANGQPAESPTSTTYDYSPYEEESIALATEERGLTVDNDPEGKIVERIEVVTFDTIEPRDPAPGFLNVFHTISKPRVIEREVLLRPGDRYRKILADETARNLRLLQQLTVVIVVPTRGSTPDRVVLLVITKDVWSLRLNSDFRYSSGGLEKLIVQPSETNLAGLHHSASLRFEMDPASMSFGAAYTIPRLTDARLLATAQGNVIINRDSSEAEGSYGGFILGHPLLSTLSKWSWETRTIWLYEVTRRFVNARISGFDAEVTPQRDGIPDVYRTRRVVHRTGVTRSFGWATKNDIGVGAEYDHRAYELPDLSTYAPEAVNEYRERRLPTNDTRVSPYVQWQGYATDYLRILDFERLGLQEDYRLGHGVVVKAYPASADLGSSRTLFGLFAGGQYTIPFIDGFARVAVESQTEVESDRLADASIQGHWRVVTPRLGFGRLLVDTLVLHRYRNYLNRKVFLGGESRLRGYPSNYDEGASLVSNNIEYRSRPVEILSLQLGGAAFFDVGDAFDDVNRMRIKKSVGFGMRALFPQLDRVVFRLDVGFPVTAGRLPPGVSPASFFVSFGQAFSVPQVEPPP